MKLYLHDLRTQVLVCSDFPSQSFPPCCGAGWSHLRERSCVPFPQLALHLEYSLHKLHPPLTVLRKTK